MKQAPPHTPVLYQRAPSMPPLATQAVLADQAQADGPADIPSRLQLDPALPPITPAQSLTGWHRELCVELLGEGAARLHVRAVQHSSFKATEMQRGVLFHRLDVRFTDLAGCVQALRPDLESLARTARRSTPSKANLFVALEFDRSAWDRVEQGVDRWARR